MHNITLPSIAAEALTEHRREIIELSIALGLSGIADDTLAFPKMFNNESQTSGQRSGYWREAVLSLGLPDVSLHALRHTHASQFTDTQVDIVCVSKRLGHAALHDAEGLRSPVPQVYRRQH